MKRFIFKMTVFLLGLLSILSAIAVVFAVCPKDQSSYVAAQLDKHKLLEETSGERIVFVGGSNLAFGLDCKRIAVCAKRKSLNVGLHAGLGLKFMLSDVEPLLHNGDIVVIMPEYAQFSKSLLNGDEILAELVLKYYPHGLMYLDGYQFANLLKNAPGVIRSTLLNEGLAGRRANSVPDNVYQRGYFSEDGDMVGYLEMKGKHIEKGAAIGDISEMGDGIKVLNDFNARVSSRGIKCFLMYPGYREEAFRADEGKIEKIDCELRKKLDFSILGTPGDFRFEDGLFFDTNYHLNKIGREKRTEMVIELMKEVTAISIPESGTKKTRDEQGQRNL